MTQQDFDRLNTPQGCVDLHDKLMAEIRARVNADADNIKDDDRRRGTIIFGEKVLAYIDTFDSKFLYEMYAHDGLNKISFYSRFAAAAYACKYGRQLSVV